ncbi:hypothetical protein HELRODRAFT_194657 [Helobdella robusta]|uniref:UDP-N-acetylglucosamine transporter n=1 Tax=Helobdella robusta TaxID=6412 RepID=T1FWA3_HELRO|nr:hypothetical protein HELRODRAFT_194657 [Helobdella robusta]ESN90146.1 hypothetical protein HELRODRAFT_194657 [Helobdella robusta]
MSKKFSHKNLFSIVTHTSKLTKYSSLLCLTLQNVALIIAMRYSRMRHGDKYIMTTAVVAAETLKFVSCLLIILIQEGSYSGWVRHLHTNIIKQPLDCLKISVPGIIYMVQNNLLYIAVANLEAATFQVVYQLKILTTALFSVSMLGKQLRGVQWISLFILFAGVSMIIHMQANESKQLHKLSDHVTSKSAILADEVKRLKDPKSAQNPLLGIVAVLISCVLSGFAGVYFERLLKNTPQSLYIRNVQLGAFGVLTGLVTVIVFDSKEISEKGFFFGYDFVVVLLIVLQSVGGILVAVVVKYADNILKGFATSAAIVVSCIVSIVFFDFQPSSTFLVATVLVIWSVYMYNSGTLTIFGYSAARKSVQNV